MFVGSWIASGVASCVSLCACQACSCMGKEVMRRSARATYCILFCFAMVLAWVLRDFAEPLLEKIPWIVRHHDGGSYSDKWFGMQAVYRISMGNFMFFGVMALTLLGVKYKSDNRDKFIHHGNWLVKLGVWMLFNALPFFFPNSVVLGYGWLARFGSGIFLVIQMCILLDFTQSWNDTWVAEGQDNPKYLWALLGITAGCYVGSTAVSAILYYLWGRPVEGSEGVSCSLNILLITFTLLMCLLFSLVSISPQLAPNGSLFPSAVITLYSTYLAFSALQSEPHNYECNSMGAKESAASYSTLALGVVATLFAVTYAAFRAGSNTQAFFAGSDSDDEEALLAENQQALTSAGVDGEGEGEDAVPRESNNALKEFEPVSYNYSFFHLVFALASMYIAMLMTGWGTNAAEKDFIDVGWTSVWVKICSQWVTGLVYTWCLMAPVLLPDRVFT